MQQPRMVLSELLLTLVKDGPEISDATYGLGLTVGRYRGRKHEHLHLAGLKPKLDACHLPRTLDPQNQTEKVHVAHHARLRHLHHPPGRACDQYAGQGRQWSVSHRGHHTVSQLFERQPRVR